jgi:hypothetical protein
MCRSTTPVLLHLGFTFAIVLSATNRPNSGRQVVAGVYRVVQRIAMSYGHRRVRFHQDYITTMSPSMNSPVSSGIALSGIRSTARAFQRFQQQGPSQRDQRLLVAEAGVLTANAAFCDLCFDTLCLDCS